MMPKGYWIANMTVHDPDVYDRYRRANAKPFAEFGARFLVRGGTQQGREGAARPRTVVIEFPSYAEAVACYESPAYQAARDIRLDVSDGTLIIVEGYDG
tara:strand:+ start:531 stop:827 length:297 start_codon:yes stop_codon:yes gene_type:complete